FKWVVLSTGIGFGALALETLALGLMGLYTTPALTLLVLMSAVLSLPVVRFRGPPRPAGLMPFKTMARLPLALTGGAVLLYLLFSLVPPVFFDAMTYHLELPSRYLLEGRIYHVTENLYSGYPQVLEVLYGLGLAVGGVGFAGLISWTTALLALMLLWTWGRSRFGEEGAAWGTAMLALTPPVMILAGFYHNDWALTFYTVSVISLLEGDRTDVRRMMLAGVMAGLAAGCKYTGLAFGLAIPMFAGVLDDFTRKRSIPWARWIVYLSAALVVAAPWYLKNLVFTGDPVYPLLASFLGKVPGVRTLAADTHFHGLGFSDLWSWILLPYQAVFRPAEIQLPMSVGILSLALIPLLPSLRGTRTVSRYMGMWMALSMAVWYVTFRAGRFALPMAAIMALWFGVALSRTVAASRLAGRALVWGVVLLLMANAGTFIGFGARYANIADAAFGTMPLKNYLEKNYLPYPALRYLNTLDPPPDKVLFLGEMKGFYSRFQREVATFEVPNRLLVLIRRGDSPAEIADTLKNEGFSHILLHPREMARLAEKTALLRLSPQESEALAEFLEAGTVRVFEQNGVHIMEIARE
ncbi:hypothetical protein EP232_00335, partial [bacterium]